MALTDARALHPTLAVAPADPVGDAAALARLAAACGRYSPWTVPHGSRRHLARHHRLCPSARRRGEPCRRAGRASCRPGHQRACRYRRHARRRLGGGAFRRAAAITLVPPGGARAALESSSIMGLRLDPAVVAELDRLGLHRIGDLYALPREARWRRAVGDGGGAASGPGARRRSGAAVALAAAALALGAPPLRRADRHAGGARRGLSEPLAPLCRRLARRAARRPPARAHALPHRRHERRGRHRHGTAEPRSAPLAAPPGGAARRRSIPVSASRTWCSPRRWWRRWRRSSCDLPPHPSPSRYPSPPTRGEGVTGAPLSPCGRGSG